MELQTTKKYIPFSIQRERLALILLVGQSFFLGYAFALLYTVANSLFVISYGSNFLPFVFIAIAFVVPLFSFVFSKLQKYWLLSRLTFLTTAFFMCMFFLSWLGLLMLKSKWLSFALLVSFTLGGLLCGIVRNAQAGYIFDARKLKQMYPLIIGGEISGVILGGVSSIFLADFLGNVENILLFSGGSMLLLLFLVIITASKFRDELLQSKKKIATKKVKGSLKNILKKRYIVLIFLYQILSAMGTRIVYYLFLNQAEAHFKTPEILTQFFGIAMAVVTVLTLLFVLLLAGKLLTRFGISLGLTGNPVGVGIAIAGAAIAGALLGPGISLFFWFIMIAGFLDIILTSGLTDTTIQSSYQPLPPGERTTVQTLVEGVGIPVAYGLSGACLLLFNWIEALNLLHVVYFTFFLSVLWVIASILLYRNYRVRLKQSIRRRILDQTEFLIIDKSSLEVIEKLLQSPEAKEVIFALEFLEKAEHPSLNDALIKSLNHREPEVRKTALASIERLKVEKALPELHSLRKIETTPQVKAGIVRALCALKPYDIEGVLPYLEDQDQDIRISAIAGLFRYGGIGGVLAAVDRFNEIANSTDVSKKITLANILQEIAIRDFYQPLLPLLGDESLDVRKEALLSAGKIANPRLWPYVIENLKMTETRSAAMSALMAGGEDIFPILEDYLNGKKEYDKLTIIRLIRVCTQASSEKVIPFFKRFIDYHDHNIQHKILTSLNLCGYKASDEDHAVVKKVLFDQFKHALRILISKDDFGDDKAFDLLKTSLSDEFKIIRRRIFLLLSFLYDKQAIMGAELKLSSGIKPHIGLALELLDVTLSKELKRYIFLLYDENIPLKNRVNDLKTLLNLDNMSRNERLREIITGTDKWSMNWTRACGIYAAALLGIKELAEAIESVLRIMYQPVRQTAVWALHKLDPQIYLKHSAEFLKDPNPQISELALGLKSDNT